MESRWVILLLALFSTFTFCRHLLVEVEDEGETDEKIKPKLDEELEDELDGYGDMQDIPLPPPKPQPNPLSHQFVRIVRRT